MARLGKTHPWSARGWRVTSTVLQFMARAALFLIPYEDGTATSSYARVIPPELPNTTNCRFPHILPTPSWFLTRLQESGIQPKSVLRRLSGRKARRLERVRLDEASASALILVEKSTYNHGPCTQWTPEQDLLRQYYGLPTDSYGLSILEVHPCKELVHGMIARDRRARLRTLTPLCVPDWSGQMPLIQDRQGQFHPATDMLRHWGIAEPLSKVFCLLYPRPIVELICQSHWQDLVILTRWHNHDRRGRPQPWIPNFPPADSLAWRKGQDSVQTSAVTADGCKSLLSFLCRMEPRLSDDGDDANRAEFYHHVEQVRRWGMALDVDHVVNSQIFATTKHKAEKLIAFISNSDYISSNDHLRGFLSEILPLILPKVLCNELTSEEYLTKIVPCSATSRFYEFTFDMAIMLWRRHWVQRLGPAARRVSCGSSPPANVKSVLGALYRGGIERFC